MPAGPSTTTSLVSAAVGAMMWMMQPGFFFPQAHRLTARSALARASAAHQQPDRPVGRGQSLFWPGDAGPVVAIGLIAALHQRVELLGRLG